MLNERYCMEVRSVYGKINDQVSEVCNELHTDCESSSADKQVVVPAVSQDRMMPIVES